MGGMQSHQRALAVRTRFQVTHTLASREPVQGVADINRLRMYAAAQQDRSLLTITDHAVGRWLPLAVGACYRHILLKDESLRALQAPADDLKVFLDA